LKQSVNSVTEDAVTVWNFVADWWRSCSR